MFIDTSKTTSFKSLNSSKDYHLQHRVMSLPVKFNISYDTMGSLTSQGEKG